MKGETATLFQWFSKAEPFVTNAGPAVRKGWSAAHSGEEIRGNPTFNPPTMLRAAALRAGALRADTAPPAWERRSVRNSPPFCLWKFVNLLLSKPK